MAEWYDWAGVKFYNEDGGYSYYPSKILLFLKDDDESSQYNNLMAIVQCSENEDKSFPSDKIYRIVDRCVLNDDYYMVDVDIIDDTCYVIPDINESGHESDKSVIIVHPMNTWGDEFKHLVF